MRTFLSGILLASAFAVGVNAAPASSDWSEQWYYKKYGRHTPAEEARLRAEQESTASREETRYIAPPLNWNERYFRAKFGRNTPAVDARLRAERESAAFREEPERDTSPVRTPAEQWFQKKYGRYPGKN